MHEWIGVCDICYDTCNTFLICGHHPNPDHHRYAAWGAIVRNASTAQWDLMSSTSSLAELGTLVNTQSMSLLRHAIGPSQAQALSTLSGEPLPSDLALPTAFDAGRVPLLRVPVVRTVLTAGEPLRLTAFVVANPAYAPLGPLTLSVSPLNGGPWTQYPVALAPSDGPARMVYSVTVDSAQLPSGHGCRWYLTARLRANTTAFSGPDALLPAPGASFAADAITLVFPPAAPAAPQTLVYI